ncbi:MAG: hypothetical protein N4A49_01815 [Marinifilaceae bacterium]|jgi:hypothetical protein|nr:hypothetical protein [Marinifilaceae bacterium]
MGTVKKQVWIKGVVARLQQKEDGSWLDGVDNLDQYVDNDTLHLTDSGIDPEVLINNTTYPIPIQDFDDEDIAIKLDKYQTKATSISDDELEACTYDKIGRAKNKHADNMSDKKFQKALHSICPAKHTANTPVLIASGADDGTGRKRLVRNDIINLKIAFDNAGIAIEGRRLVLNSQHCGDLLLEDKEFRALYTNHKKGKISDMYDFEIYQSLYSPLINKTTKAKVSFGAVAGDGDLKASVAFVKKRVSKAKGSTKMYSSKAENNPTTQRNLVNFRHRFIALPQKQQALGAII